MQGKKISENIWSNFLMEMNENFGSITHTCNKLGISRRSYYGKRLKDPIFARKVDTLFEQVQVPMAEEMLRADVMERKAWAIRFTLERASRKWNRKFNQEYLYDLEFKLLGLEEKLIEKNKRQ